jgi:hypothetical protein
VVRSLSRANINDELQKSVMHGATS